MLDVNRLDHILSLPIPPVDWTNLQEKLGRDRWHMCYITTYYDFFLLNNRLPVSVLCITVHVSNLPSVARRLVKN